VLDFDQYCLAVAALFAALSLRQFRLVNFVMLANFTIYKITSHYILAVLNGKPAMILHAAYMVISGLTVILLVNLKASPPLFVTTLLFSGYNLAIVSEYLFFGPIGFHSNFEVVAQSQMIIELMIMFITSVGGLYVCRGLYPRANYIHIINRLFRVGPRMGSERFA